MSRIPLAAKMLVEQVVENFPDTQVTQSNVDGLNTYRTVSFSGDAAEWLSKGDLALVLDHRVTNAEMTDEGFAVTFVGDPRADYASPKFSLAEVVAITEGDEDEKSNDSAKRAADQEESMKPPKKTAAKKTSD